MPKRTDISSSHPSHPVGGEGRRFCAGERGAGAWYEFSARSDDKEFPPLQTLSPRWGERAVHLIPSANPLPPNGERALGLAPSPQPLSPRKVRGAFGIVTKLDDDYAQHPIEIGHDFGVREAQDAKSSLFEQGGSHTVMGLRSAERRLGQEWCGSV